MSSEPQTLDPPHPNLDEELSRTLVMLYQLSSDALEQINDLMKKLHIRFAEAALESGVVTRQELDQALDWISQHPVSQSQGLIEEVLRRTARKRETVVWQRDQLCPAEQLILAHRPDDPHSETMRSLRTELLLRCKGHRGAAMITLLSPCSGEGRSLLAAELAIAFAQLDRRTLLVDADLRKPGQHLLFGADNDIGLAQALTAGGPHHLHGVKGLPDMALMTSGGPPQNPLNLLSGRIFERAISDWRRNFEFVIIDTPPTTRFSDALTVAAASGYALIVGRANSTRFAELNEIRRALSTTESVIVGAVLNGF
jgi:protein-tyrosine kinase